MSQRIKHGLHNTPIYRAWKNMMDRCYNENHKYYRDYGGRGIKVCDSWHDLLCFVEDMSPRPDGHTLDRINNDGDYTRDNCRWTTQTHQIRNRRNTIRISVFGESKTLMEWSQDERCSVSYDTLYRRFKKGFSLEKSILLPSSPGKRNIFDAK